MAAIHRVVLVVCTALCTCRAVHQVAVRECKQRLLHASVVLHAEVGSCLLCCSACLLRIFSTMLCDLACAASVVHTYDTDV
jgi:hypothetical protein